MLRVTTMIALVAAVAGAPPPGHRRSCGSPAPSARAIPLAGDNHAKSDYWYHEHADVTNAIWVFAPDGVKMFSPDGTEIKSLPHTQVCKLSEATSRGGPSQNCGFRDVKSDGHKFVMASNSQAGSWIEFFSITTGLHVASVPTCASPYLLDYAPHREELWVHCWTSDDEDKPGHIDIISTAALGLDHKEFAIDTIGTHGHGDVVVDASIPNLALGFTLDNNHIFRRERNEEFSIYKFYWIKKRG